MVGTYNILYLGNKEFLDYGPYKEKSLETPRKPIKKSKSKKKIEKKVFS